MKFLNATIMFRSLSAASCGIALVACGGGSAAPDSELVSFSDTQTLAAVMPGRGNEVGKPPAVALPSKAPTNQPAAQPGRVVTHIQIENVTPGVAQTNIPFTFGQVFAAGDLPAGSSLIGRLDDGATLPLQVNAKATHPDGSIRHAIVSGVLPSLNTSARTLNLALGAAAAGSAVTPATALASGLTASFNATIGGKRFTASADELLKSGKVTTWLAGPVANEWHVSAPLKDSTGVAHPHLSARFAIRWYDNSKKARVDVTIENNWAYETAPQNFTYDAEVLVGGKSVYAKPALTHFHHARWRKVFWMGSNEAERINVKHDRAYLIATGAVPNYDQSIVVKDATLASLINGWTGAKVEPMATGSANPYMPATGGRNEIGLLPSWTATYVLSMDARAKHVTLANGNLAGSWSMHYRDKLTDRPVSIVDFPYMTILGNSGDTLNPATRKKEAFPACATTTSCVTPNKHDTAHQPSFAYVPYLVTGDYYYLEELQFWAMYNALSSNPGYRQASKGLISPDQVRGQAWSLRTLAEAAYITPDSDRLKAHFTGFMDQNLAWYNTTYTDNPQANVLGVLLNSAIVYDSKTGVAPWQDDFFTSAVGHTADLGFTEAKRLLAWKAKFPVKRMSDEGLCWISAATYTLKVRASNTGPIFTTMQQVGEATQDPLLRKLACGSTEMASFMKLKVGEMSGYASASTGYPANMQPGLAYASQVSGAQGKAVWAKFMARSIKPDYSTAPQFAIVPR